MGSFNIPEAGNTLLTVVTMIFTEVLHLRDSEGTYPAHYCKTCVMMASHANQYICSRSIFQETDIQTSLDGSEYLHHSRTREATNTSKF